MSNIYVPGPDNSGRIRKWGKIIGTAGLILTVMGLAGYGMTSFMDHISRRPSEYHSLPLDSNNTFGKDTRRISEDVCRRRGSELIYDGGYRCKR